MRAPGAVMSASIPAARVDARWMRPPARTPAARRRLRPACRHRRALAWGARVVAVPPTVFPMRSILVTGAASGIGAGIARELADAGHHLVISDLDHAAAAAVAAGIRDAGGSAEAVALDVTCDDSVADALAAISRPVDVLVNNAGLQHVSPLEEFPPAKWDFLVQVMLVGVARLTRAVLPGMRERGFGRIVN